MTEPLKHINAARDPQDSINIMNKVLQHFGTVLQSQRRFGHGVNKEWFKKSAADTLNHAIDVVKKKTSSGNHTVAVQEGFAELQRQLAKLGRAVLGPSLTRVLQGRLDREIPARAAIPRARHMTPPRRPKGAIPARGVPASNYMERQPRIRQEGKQRAAQHVAQIKRNFEEGKH